MWSNELPLHCIVGNIVFCWTSAMTGIGIRYHERTCMDALICLFQFLYWCLGFVYLLIPNTDTIVELMINSILVSEKYLRDGREYLGCKYSSRRWKPSSSTTDIGWVSKTMNSETFCGIANAFKLSVGNFSSRWNASAKISYWAVLSLAPLVLLSCRNSACSLAWCFWMLFLTLLLCRHCKQLSN